MPSPFPGMDPYLEGELWTSLHFALAAEMVRRLAPLVQPKYLILPVERMVAEIGGDIQLSTTVIYPDVSVIDRSTTATPLATTGTATLARVPIRLETVMPVEVPHVTVEIRDAAARALVTAIEVLSPTNKRGVGREKYLAKRARLLLSRAHLVEIDLLRAGMRLPMRAPLPPACYYAIVNRAETRPLSDVWPIALADPLPTIPIPLLPEDADIPLDLQAVFTAVYDQLRLDLAVRYGLPPDGPLSPEESAWVQTILSQPRP
jgi:hypothetical protein